MQVQVITGHAGTGKTTQLQAIQAELKSQGIEAPIHIGASCTTPYFLNHLANQAMAGAKHFLADDCTQFQIKAVLELESQGEKSGLPYDLIVHLVRQA